MHAFALEVKMLPTKTALRVATLLVAAVCGASACGFKFDPAALPQYYRAEGWFLPGVEDYDPTAKVAVAGLPQLGKVLGVVPNAKAILLPHASPYVVQMPDQLFTLNGKRQRMRSVLAIAVLVRWAISGHTVAYSYSLVPVTEAHQENGKWIVQGESACLFEATFIDDRGDGVFRLLVPGPLTPEKIPQWAKQEPHG